MGTISKKQWTLWGVAAVCLALLFVVFRSCDNTPSHKDDKKEVDSIVKGVVISEKAYHQRVQGYESAIRELRKERDSLLSVVKVIKGEANKAVNRLTEQKKQYHAALKYQDTAQAVANCDTVMEELTALRLIKDDYDRLFEYEQSLHEREQAVKDSLIEAHAKAYADVKGAFNQMHDKFNEVYTDYSGLRKKHKRERTLTRVAVVAAFAAGFLISK